MTEATTYDEFKAARERFLQLADQEAGDDGGFAIRMAILSLPDRLCEDDARSCLETPREREVFDEAINLLETIYAYPYGGRDLITTLAIADSVCPIHFCDWAACFDDDLDECRQVRDIYPCSHDT